MLEFTRIVITNIIVADAASSSNFKFNVCHPGLFKHRYGYI